MQINLTFSKRSPEPSERTPKPGDSRAGRVALEGVRSGRLSRGQVRWLPAFPTRYEVDGGLKAHGVAIQESIEEVQQDSDLVLALGRR